MYLEIDEGFDSHPKTVRLCRVLGDVNAGQYLIRLWAWACRSAQDGDISGMEAADVESIAKYKVSDGKLFAALTEKWSPKFGPWIDRESDRLLLHGWDERQGAAIKRMEKHAARMRDYRAGSKPKRNEHVASTCEARSMTVQSRQDKTSTDQVEKERTRDPGTTEHQAPRNEPGKPEPRNVVAKYLAIRSELIVGHVNGAKTVFPSPQESDLTKAATWVAGMNQEECEDIEPAIRLACQHVKDGAKGWTNPDMTKVGFMFACIVRAWPDLREELHNCAPVVKTKTETPPARRTPIMD